MKKNHEQQNLIYRTLKPVNKLLDEYKSTPDPEKLNEKDISWVNDQIRCIWENLKKTDIRGFSFLREIRNSISHQDEEFTSGELTKMWKKFFPKLPEIKSKLESNVQKDTKNPEKRRFAKFGPLACGSEVERNQLIDAIEDSCSTFEKDSTGEIDKIEFPDNLLAQSAKQVLEETFNGNENQKYVQEHEGLSKNIQSDLLNWVKSVDKKLHSQNPFEKEVEYLQVLEKETPEKICSNLNKIKNNLQKLWKGNGYDGEVIDFDFYQKNIDKLPKLSENPKKNELEQIKIKQQAIAFSLIEELRKKLVERKTKWELNLIESIRKQFLSELLEKLENFKKLEKVLSGIFDETGFLWDMSQGFFKESGFEILKEFADLLEKDESLMELAQILGKHSRAQKEYEKEIRQKTVITTEYHPKPAFKGQISGIRMSNEISSVLPSELSLLKNPATKNLFKLKFAQQQLLSFKYENLAPEVKSKTEDETVSKEKEEQKGPVIICVDTSGSMSGTPENVAKTITLALTKIAAKEERNCYLISFSTGIETLDLSRKSGKGENSISTLIKFLCMSFNGGTDAAPALNHALNMLDSSEWKNADVLMISDFVMGNLGSSLISKINKEKENKTDFYSLVIGSSGEKNVIECFNHNWFYDMNDRNASRHLVEQLSGLV